MIKAQIVDNTKDGLTMAKILDSTIPHAGTMDVSTGYFSVGGYGLLRGSLERSGIGMRLLLGKETMIPDDHPFESYARMHGFEPDAAPELTTKSALDESSLTVQTLQDTVGLLSLLRRDDVLVRTGKRRFNHSKCYILGETAVFIGSSNFTRGGLTGNYELNSVRYDPNPIRDTQEWFDRMWKEADDAKDKLISILEQSKFGVPPDPYDVYIKMLFERYKHMFKASHDLMPADHLTRFQHDAVKQCMGIMSEFGGALVADATGLGKTEIALDILRRKALRDGRKKILLIAPAQVLKGMWDARLKDTEINVQYRMTMEELGRESILERLGKYSRVDMVVIDESQNFRSKNTNRRKNLMKLLAQCRRKPHVLLLSATPVNNSLMDLYYQLSIITRGDNQCFYKTIGIPDLYVYMRDASNRDSLPQGLAKIEQLMASVMVRRTRSYIQEVYPDDKISGRKIRFPEHRYSPIRYNLSEIFGDVFETLSEGILSLKMAPYGLEQYDTTMDENEKKKRGALAHLQSILLLKRFESSKQAAQTSLENKILLYKYVRRAVEHGKILRVKSFNRIAERWSLAELEGGDSDLDMDGNNGGEFMQQIESVDLEDLGDNYDIKSMKKDMDEDLVILERLWNAVKNITLDTKLLEVTKAILGDMNSKGICKAIIFTEYTATAEYITKHLSENLLPRTVVCITGGTDKKTRAQYIRRFAPKANPSETPLEEKEIDVLVSTEVLAEGQNLQDCNYVVNYDLPWNPMRIVQRIGRVDRLTSDHDTIYSRACYPDDDLDKLLKLMGKLVHKIALVNDLGLLDTELLEAVPTPKQFDGGIVSRHQTLATGSGSKSVIEAMERESDLMPGASPLNELNRYMKKQSLEYMEQIPIGRRSGKKGETQKAVLMYVESYGNSSFAHGSENGRIDSDQSSRQMTHFVVYDYKERRARIPIEDEAIRLVSCHADEPRHLPMDGPDWKESFLHLRCIDAKARDAVLEKINNPLGGAISGARRPDMHAKNANDLAEIIGGGSDISEDAAESVLQIIKSEDIRAYDDDIRNMISEYRHIGDVKMLMDGIRNIGKNIGVSTRPVEHEAVRSNPTLRLIGAMFVSGERFDPDLAKACLDDGCTD